MEAEKIPMEKRMNYEQLKKCFVKNDGSTFNENFKNLKKTLEYSLTSDKRTFIGKTLKSLPS